jgi:hypothetical protein
LCPTPEFSPIEETEEGIKTCDDIEFMRPWTEEIYGILPEQVIGSSASGCAGAFELTVRAFQKTSILEET